MKLDNNLLHQFFIEQNIHFLYHANSVSSSITYIQNYGLLSRGNVEEKGLFQTTQGSDELDKTFDVWSDVFLDTTDLHTFFSRQNKYGPVLFVFKIDFLLNDNLDIWITKDNPIYWSSTSPTENYFQTVDELKQAWKTSDRQRIMITIRKPEKPILFNSLDQVVLDNPKVKVDDHTILLTEATKALSIATEGQETLRGKFVLRNCKDCWCQKNYLGEISANILKKMFLLQN